MADSPLADVVVVGGGPAGLTTALDLARRGWVVVVRERHRSGRRRLCGEFLSGDGWAALEGLGLAAALEAAGCPAVGGVEITAHGATWQTRVPGLGHGCTRRLLIQSLETAARAAGVRIQRGARGLHPGAGGDLTGPSVSPAARVTVWAAGQSGAAAYQRASHVGRRRRWLAVAVHGQPMRAGSGSEGAESVHLHAVRGGYVGVGAVEGGRVNVCALLTATAVRGVDPLEAVYQAAVCNRHLDKALRNVRVDRGSMATAAGLDFGRRRRCPALSVGDAAAAPAPVLGQGLAAALCGGRLLAGWVDRHLRGELNAEELALGYRRAWRAQFEPRLRLGRWLHGCLLRPRLAAVGLALLRGAPALGPALVRRTRGPLRSAGVVPQG